MAGNASDPQLCRELGHGPRRIRLGRVAGLAKLQRLERKRALVGRVAMRAGVPRVPPFARYLDVTTFAAAVLARRFVAAATARRWSWRPPSHDGALAQLVQAALLRRGTSAEHQPAHCSVGARRHIGD
jgi:hypothetical protein